MQSKILSKRVLLLTVVISGLVFSIALLLFLYFFPKSSVQGGSASIIESAVAFQKQEQAISKLPASLVGRPVRLKIPSINVDAPVEYVGLTSDGAMDVPEEHVGVGWFNLGPRPGEEGGAVIAGHYGWKNGKASVFDNLYKLRKGDKLYIEDEQGVIIFFVVRESRRYDPKADASGAFGSNDGKSHLNLVTCEGVWDKVSKSYSKRLVVFTDKE